MKAIVLAGGKSTRLAPYTTILPKPLMPIGEMPIKGERSDEELSSLLSQR